MSYRSLSLRHAVATTLALASVVAANSAASQETSETSSTTLGEIIVTAQKREQSLQDVPVVVTALSEELLQDAGVRDIKEMTVLTPGLTVTSTSSEASTTARIRGIGTVGDNPGLESSVGVIIDGVYRPRNGVGFGDLGEVERIEVVKGPQGTLFGKNTTAGVINVVSKAPSFEPSSRIEVTGGNYGAFETSASINGPVVGDTVAGRLYAAIRQREGLIDIETGGGPRRERTDNDRDFYTVRGQLLVEPTDAVSVRLIGDATERDENCCVGVQVVYGSAGVRSFIDAVAPGPGGAPVANPFARIGYANRGTEQNIRDRGLSLEVEAEIGDMTLTSVSGGRDWLYQRGQDSDFTTADLLYRDGTDNSVVTRFQQLSQELRLAGENGAVNWLGGLFYAKEKLTQVDSLRPGIHLLPYIALNATALAGLAPSPVLPGTWGVTSPFTGWGSDKYQQDAESFAAFTNNSIEVAEGLELTLGARYTQETKDLASFYSNGNSTSTTACSQIRTAINASAATIAAGGAPAIPTGAWTPLAGFGCSPAFDPNFSGLTQSESLDENKTTGTAKIAYRFNDVVMVYGSYALGYKASGFNLDRVRQPNPSTSLSPVPALAASLRNINPVAATDKSFKPETVDSIEVGTKVTLFDNALLLNVTYFNQKYEDFQYNTFTGIQFEVRSLEEVTSTGVDADIIYRTPMGIDIQGGVTYAETEMSDAAARQNADLFNNLRESNTLPFAPEWSASLALSYNTTFGDYAFGSSIGAKYNSEYNTGSNLDPRKGQDSYTLVNARLGFGSADEKWTVELWGQNVTDEEYVQVAFDATFQGSSASGTPAAPAAPTSTINAFLGAPRLYGASLILKF